MGRKLYLGSQAVTPVVTVEKTVVPNHIAPKNNVNGEYKADNTATSFSLNGATDVDEYALYQAFYGCTNLTSVDLSSLTTVSKKYALYHCFDGCTGVVSVDVSSLTSVGGANSLQACFKGCAQLSSVTFGSLTTIGSTSGMAYCFQDCIELTSVDLGSLTTVSGGTAMNGCFSGCTGLTTVTIGGTTAIDFGTTKINQFQNMFSGCDQESGIDLYIATTQEKLSTMTGYPSFGATCEVRIHYTAQ